MSEQKKEENGDMYLSQQEIELFYKIWYGLMHGINERHKIALPFKKSNYGERVDEEPFVYIREQLWQNPHLTKSPEYHNSFINFILKNR